MSDLSGNAQQVIGRRRLVAGIAATAGLAVAGGSPLRAAVSPNWPLWSVERGNRKVYLIGETPPRAIDWHDGRVENLLRTCATLWTETNQVVRSSTAALVQRYGMIDAKPLDTWLTADDRSRLAKAVAYCKVPLDSLASLRPWLAGASLQDAYYAAAGQPGKSADRILAERALNANIAVSSEFAAQDDVFAWFGAMSASQNVQFLRYALDEILAGPVEGERIYLAWSRGRPERAARVMNRMQHRYADLFAKIAVERNRNWLPRFDNMLGDKRPSLVVVGLYHLAGPANLLGQLRESGLTVRRI